MERFVQATCVVDWPKLAWVAVLKGQDPIRLLHGEGVEVNDHWFGEIAWDGEYQQADFDRAEHVIGSGARYRDGKWCFVGATSVIDRLQWTQTASETMVSNTFCGLAAIAGLTPEVHRNNYPELFGSICDGLENYERTIPMMGGEVQLVYWNNLVWDGKMLSETAKPSQKRDLSTYRRYRDHMDATMRSLSENWGDARRNNTYQPIASISTGYDSPAVCALGKVAGLREALTITRGRSGSSDDGTSIAESLGLMARRIRRDGWTELEKPELPYLSSDAKGEDLYFSSAQRWLDGRVLMTGYAGTRVWGIRPQLSQHVERSDQSGLSHTEARLHQGYLHFAVPFLHSRQTADLRALSMLPEMEPWHVPGSYNCPLARRIVEEAGGERESFGMEKKAASVLLFDRECFLTKDSEAAFREWYNRTFTRTDRNKLALKSIGRRVVRAAAGFAQQTCRLISRQLPIPVTTRIANSSRLTELASFEPLFAHLFPWASQQMIDRYAGALQENTDP